ncbi:MAG: formate dehydrogenase subunit gamma [Proteobacteria bacterium]|nr:formate dehydrogenase subunit gamma [Pseudomonadota bacterium]
MLLVCHCPLFLKLPHILLRGLLCLFLGLLLALFPGPGDLYAAEDIAISKSGTDLWQAVRQRSETVKGISQVPGTESGVLINSMGQDWRHYRTKWLIPLSGGLFLFTFCALMVYFLVRGRIPIHDGVSGKRILRTTRTERVIHWFNAAVFLPLAFTGLLMLYGRWLLIPLIGREDFAQIAALSKAVHNYLGPLFIVSLVLLFVVFVKESFFLAKIWEHWVLRLGGYFGGREPVSGKFNPGQKAWFWTLSLFGSLLCLSGLVLDFPLFGLERVTMILAHVVHTLSATLVIAFLFIHIYLGGIGIVGVFQSMVHGYVDAHWARQHHYCWYREMARQKKIEPSAESDSADCATRIGHNNSVQSDKSS